MEGRGIIVMSPQEYVVALNRSQRYRNKQAVNYRIRNGLTLFGVKGIKNILGRNVLYVNKLKLVGLVPIQKNEK